MAVMHELKRTNKTKKKQRIGRGGKRGTYSGRGQKGQRARAGRNIRSQEREALSKIPKKRGTGFDRRSHNRAKQAITIDIAVINRVYAEGEVVSPKTLMAKGLIGRSFARIPRVKILGSAAVVKRLIIKQCDVSESVRKKIEGAKGTC